MRSLNVFFTPAVADVFFFLLRKNEGNRVRGKFPLLFLRRGGTSGASDGVVNNKAAGLE